MPESRLFWQVPVNQAVFRNTACFLSAHISREQHMELLKEYSFIKEIPVFWGDMDSFRHVNNVVYFRWFEIARIAYFENLKAFRPLPDINIGPILVKTSATYLKAISYPDTVSVGVKSVFYSEEKIEQNYAIVSHRKNVICTEGDAVIFGYDYKAMKRAPIPQDVLKAIERMESRVDKA